MKISCIALAGGKSTRLGRNKLEEVIGGKMLIDRVLSTLSLLHGEIIIVASKQTELPILNSTGVKIVYDLYPGTGSLGAIYTGLASSESDYNVVVACDMPFLNSNLLNYMVRIAEGFDFVAYNQYDRPEPLHAVYSRNCLRPIELLIKNNRLRIINILPFIKERYLFSYEIDKFDPQHLSFFNINTENDLQRAIQLSESFSLTGLP